MTIIHTVFLIFMTAVLLGVMYWMGKQLIFAFTMFFGAVFVPSADDKLESMLKLAKPKKTDVIVDLGSGDGKVVFALAELGHTVEGVEINPLLVKEAQKKAEELGLSNKVSFSRQNFWSMDFSKYDIVFLYGTTYIMKRLEKKLQAELKPGARVISNYFQFPTWEHEVEENEVRVYRMK